MSLHAKKEQELVDLQSRNSELEFEVERLKSLLEDNNAVSLL